MGGVGLIGSTVGALGDLRSVDPGATRGFNNAMPTPYTGFDMYGNPSNWQLPRSS